MAKEWSGIKWSKDCLCGHRVYKPSSTASVKLSSVWNWQGLIALSWWSILLKTESCSLAFLFFLTWLTLFPSFEVFCASLRFLRWAPPVSCWSLSLRVYTFVWSRPGIRWRLTTHCSACVCVCLSVACTLGRTKRHPNISRIIIISMATASSTSCSFSPLSSSVCG